VGMTRTFDLKKVRTPLLLHMLGQELRFPRIFLLMRKLTLNRFKKTIDPRFPRGLIDLAALPAWVYLSLREKIGQRKAFEIMRVALLTGGTAAQNLQFDPVNKVRTFDRFADLEVENNRSGLVRWNTMEVVERTVARPTGRHIEYVSPHFFIAAVMSLYLLSTCIGPILSTHRMVRVFGVFALLSFGAVYYFYATWFISVWCFFAALLSAIILGHGRAPRMPAHANP
jgi:hypothetical protein